MDTPIGETQSKTRAAHQKTLRGKEGFEMKATMGTGRAKVWISEKVGTKIATRLFRGLALGALLVAATGLYFSINQGGQSEAGSPLASEQGACYPLYPELGPCASEFVAVTPTIADRNDRGLFDEVLPEDLKPGEGGSPLSSEQFELITDLEMMGIPWRIDDQGRVLVVEEPRKPSTDNPLASEQFEDWPEVGFDSYTYHRFMVEQGKLEQAKASNRLNREQLELIQDYDMVGIPWRVDADGNVVELPWQKFASRPNFSEQIECYPEVDYSQCTRAGVESLAEFK